MSRTYRVTLDVTIEDETMPSPATWDWSDLLDEAATIIAVAKLSEA